MASKRLTLDDFKPGDLVVPVSPDWAPGIVLEVDYSVHSVFAIKVLIVKPGRYSATLQAVAVSFIKPAYVEEAESGPTGS